MLPPGSVVLLLAWTNPGTDALGFPGDPLAPAEVACLRPPASDPKRSKGPSTRGASLPLPVPHEAAPFLGSSGP